MANRLLPPVLTRRRIWLAYSVAIGADAVQFFLAMFGPPGWIVDDAIDVVAMVLLTLVVGFHPLFIPTFVAELLPVVDMLPTWTGCTAIVIAMRRRHRAPETPPRIPPRDVIDV